MSIHFFVLFFMSSHNHSNRILLLFWARTGVNGKYRFFVRTQIIIKKKRKISLLIEYSPFFCYSIAKAVLKQLSIVEVCGEETNLSCQIRFEWNACLKALSINYLFSIRVQFNIQWSFSLQFLSSLSSINRQSSVYVDAYIVLCSHLVGMW